MANSISKKTFDHKVLALPSIIVPDDHYFVIQPDETVKHYIGDASAIPREVTSSSALTSKYTSIILTAGETISGGKVVSIHEDGLAYVYNILNEDEYFRVFGIAKQAVTYGNTFEVYISGEVIEVGSGWQFGKSYFVSGTGLLIESVPTLGIIKKIATGLSTDKVFLISNTTDLITI